MARRGKGKGKNRGRVTEAQKQALQAAITESEAAGLTSTSGYRSPSHYLTRANPGSLHARARAFDLRARTPAAADSVIAAQKAIFDARGLVAGRDYRIIDETRHPSRHATAPHVHVEFTEAGMARYQGLTQPDAATNVAANVPTPTARPAQPGDINPFSDTTYSPEAEATAAPGGLRPGFRTAMGGAAAQGAFQRAVGLLGQPEAASPRGTVGGLLGGNLSKTLGLGGLDVVGHASLSPDKVGQYQTGLMSPGSGSMPGQEGGGFVNRDFAPESKFTSNPFDAPSPGSLRSRSPAPSPESGKGDRLSGKGDRLGASPEPSDPDRFGGAMPPSTPANEERSFTPSPAGLATHIFTPSGLPDTAPAPTLADRAVRESITSALPDQGPTLADRPGIKAAAAQPATPDVVKALADEDTDAVVSPGPKAALAKLGTPEATGAKTTDTGLDASPDGPLDVEPLDKGTYPPKPDVFNPGPTTGLFNYGTGLAARKAATGLLGGGLPGALFGGLGSLISQNMPSGFNEAVPESSRFSVGSGLTGINAALSGPKGATATSRTQKGASVTSLGNGQSLRRSDRYGWTEVVGPDGSVVGIQYDHPQTKGLLGKVSNWAGSTFGGSNGLSPSASRAIRDKTDGGLY